MITNDIPTFENTKAILKAKDIDNFCRSLHEIVAMLLKKVKKNYCCVKVYF